MCHGYHIEGSYPIEWCFGEPMPIFFYRILQHTTLQHNQHANILIPTIATT